MFENMPPVHLQLPGLRMQGQEADRHRDAASCRETEREASESAGDLAFAAARRCAAAVSGRGDPRPAGAFGSGAGRQGTAKK